MVILKGPIIRKLKLLHHAFQNQAVTFQKRYIHVQQLQGNRYIQQVRNTKQKLTWHAWSILCKKWLSVSPGFWTNVGIGLSSFVIPGNIISFPTKSSVLISPSFCFLFFLLLLFFACIVPSLSAWFIFINCSTLLGNSWKSTICGGALILFCKLHKT